MPAERAAALLAEVGDAATPYAAYAWYCAGEADLAVDVERARHASPAPSSWPSRRGASLRHRGRRRVEGVDRRPRWVTRPRPPRTTGG